MSDSSAESNMKAYHKRIKRKHLILKVLIASIFTIISVTLAITTYISKVYPDSGKFMGRIITSVGFALLGFTFSFFGIRILQKLKFAFPDFYAENSSKLIFATFGLSIPMVMRSVCDLLIVVSSSCRNFLHKHLEAWNYVSLLVFDIIPISF